MEGEGEEGQYEGEFEWIGEEKAAEVDATKAATTVLSLFLWTSCWRRQERPCRADEDQGSRSFMNPKGFSGPISDWNRDRSRIF